LGQEIAAPSFTADDHARFRQLLEAETALARAVYADGAFSDAGPVAGFELEAWLVDRNLYPAPHNQDFLARLADPLVVPELSRFNIELNGTPQGLAGDGLLRLEQELEATWRRCVDCAHADVDTAVAIGTLPTLRDSDLSPANMTPSNRYAALNRSVLAARGGAPVDIDIDCADPDGEHLRSRHDDVMLEAATTSFQLHLQAPHDRIVRTLNASSVLSAPLLALGANSPFLFGKQLWHETRIAIFEQAFEGPNGDARTLDARRVTFGSGYAGADPTEVFAENLARYPVLLPMVEDAAPGRFKHMRLHNGTIWRWNRLLVGFDDDGAPHLRVEQRVLPAGPTIIDMMANAAFYYGLVHMLATRPGAPEAALPFATARDNFYAAARHGMDAQVTWLDGQRGPVRELLATLAPIAREGLARQGVSPAAIDRYMDLVDLRVASGRNGAAWQIAHHRRHGDLFRLTADYLERQRSGMPVHEWPD